MRVPELSTTIEKTKLQGDSQLFTRTFQGERGERVVSLLHVHGRQAEGERLAEEWYRIIERTLLHSEEGPYERLEGALKEMNGLLKGMLISGNLTDTHAIIALYDADRTLHVAQAGRAEAYLTRQGSTTQITEAAATPGDHAQFLHIASGALQEGDVVLLSTVRLLRTMTPAQITQHARRAGETLERVREALEREQDTAALALLAWRTSEEPAVAKVEPRGRALLSSPTSRKAFLLPGKRAAGLFTARRNIRLPSWDWRRHLAGMHSLARGTTTTVQGRFGQFVEDLQHPTRKRRAHLLLLAGAIVVFVGIWSGFQISTISKKTQTRMELEQLVEKINGDLKMAENRHLMGDVESANAILARAEQEAKGVMQNESGLFRTDALDLLDRIRAKREGINNIVRITPTVAANLSTRSPDVSARGLIGIERGRLIAYDRQNVYSIIVNAVDEPQRLDGENLILDGAYFDRFKTQVFLTKENRLIEIIEGEPTAMKTDDPAGWLSGPDFETYIRFLYLLSPQNNQIYKYERLSNRYSAPSEYNVSGKLDDAIDMTIDSDVYVLHQEGKVTKLLRGEEKNFVIRNLPEGALAHATRIVKPSERGNFYFLDPEEKRVIVARTDDESGESLYLKQFILESGDKTNPIGLLQDLYVDPEESQLFVLDEKKLYSISLQ